MAAVTALASSSRWWRLLVWAGLIAATVVSTPSVASRIAAGALMGAAVIALQFTRNSRLGVRRASVLIATICGLGACFAAHDGVAEIVVVVAAARAPDAFDGVPLRWFVIVDTIAFGGTVGFISQSLPGLLAGVAIPLVVQRAVEHRDLITERDRTRALLVEAQNGREAEAQAAALRERGRIAREMHDVLAHSLAGLSVQLQAVRAVAARENVGADVLVPLDKAAALAREGLSEARSVVGTLRDPIGLGLDALPALVDRHPGSATFASSGPPGSVSPEVGHAVYRAVQESLTNAARYAPGAAVAVRLGWADGALRVVVEDTGPEPGHSPVGGQGTGLGLAGMDERVQQVGGTLRAGPRPDGGWRIDIDVPTVPELDGAAGGGAAGGNVGGGNGVVGSDAGIAQDTSR